MSNKQTLICIIFSLFVLLENSFKFILFQFVKLYFIIRNKKNQNPHMFSKLSK